jgi:hypothetical protein
MPLICDYSNCVNVIPKSGFRLMVTEIADDNQVTEVVFCSYEHAILYLERRSSDGEILRAQYGT